MTDKENFLSVNLSLRLFATLFLTILYGIFLWDSFWGLGFTIVNTVFIGTLLVVRPETTKKESLIILGFSLVLSAFIPLRSFWVGRYLTFFLVFILNCLAVARATAQNDQPLTLKSLISIPVLVGFGAFTEIILWLKRAQQYLFKGKVSSDGLNHSNLATGTLIAIPLVILFTLLLSSADPIFQRYLEDFFSKFSLDFITIKKVIEIIFFFGLFSSLLSNKYSNYSEFSLFSKNSHIQKEIAVASAFVVILLGLFLIVQSQFLFAGENLLRNLNITLSEYTRRGYGELLVVSSISLFLIFILTGSRESPKTTFLKVVTSIYILEIFLLLLSASYRVYLYQDVFGLTQARLLGMLLSLWLTGALILSLERFLRKNSTIPFFFGLFINAVAVILLMHVINIDRTIAVLSKPNLGHSIDYPYIARLSSDAWPAWEETLTHFENSPDCAYREFTATSALKYKQTQLTIQSQNSWHFGGSWSLPDTQALDYLNKNLPRIEKLQKRYEICVMSPPIEEIHSATEVEAEPIRVTPIQPIR